jgi:hypothetical protein
MLVPKIEPATDHHLSDRLAIKYSSASFFLKLEYMLATIRNNKTVTTTTISNHSRDFSIVLTILIKCMNLQLLNAHIFFDLEYIFLSMIPPNYLLLAQNTITSIIFYKVI